MRSITVVFENEDFERLVKTKGNKIWRDFIMQLVEDKNEEKKIL